jgi:hypothetical protein
MYYRARYYHPALGRFVSADTVVPEAGNPQALNRYAYGYNRPLFYVDWDGHLPIIPIIGLAAAGVAVLMLTSDVAPPPDSPVAHSRMGNQVVGEYALAGALTCGIGTLAAPGVSGAVTAGELATGAVCADGDCTNEIEATTQIIERNWTVLGKYPGYLQKAQYLGANLLNIPDDEWVQLTTRDQQWAKNVEFLDEAIARGDVFYLETSFTQGIRDGGSFYQSELLYLLKQGYEWTTLHGEEWLVPARQ